MGCLSLWLECKWHEYYFKRFLKNHLFTLFCACVFHSGCETGDAGGGAEETDEPPEQHRGEDRQVSSDLCGLNAKFLYSSKWDYD